jgi:hypothetical protein
MSGEKFPLVSMGGRVESPTCADPGARTPIGASGNFICSTVSQWYNGVSLTFNQCWFFLSSLHLFDIQHAVQKISSCKTLSALKKTRDSLNLFSWLYPWRTKEIM